MAVLYYILILLEKYIAVTLIIAIVDRLFNLLSF